MCGIQLVMLAGASLCVFVYFILVDCAALVMALLYSDSHGPCSSGFVVITML